MMSRTIADFTINRTMMVKDTFISVFPDYGVAPDDGLSMNRTFYNYSNYNAIECRKTADVDKRYFNKQDEFKYYTEELLKAKGMMSNKK